MSKGVRGILFDAGNTLVYIDPVRMVKIFRAEGVEVDTEGFRAAELDARRVIHECAGAGSRGTEPELWLAYFVDLFKRNGASGRTADRIGRRVRREHAADHLWTHALPGTAEVLESLKTAGYRIAVISNADGRMEGALETAGVRGHFEFVIDSAVIGIEKPQPEIFHAGCDALGLAAHECLYVGDLYEVDYVGATAAGLHALLIDPLGFHGQRAETVSTLSQIREWLHDHGRRSSDASHEA